MISIAPISQNFFETSKTSKKFASPKLRDLYADDIDDYYCLFLEGCDLRAFNTRQGYWDDDSKITHTWKPSKRKKGSESPYIAATRANLLSHLERHLDGDHWRQRGHRARGYAQPFWLGTLGGAYSRTYAYDIDNHKGETIKYVDIQGAHLVVPDLHLSTLSKLYKVLSWDYCLYGLPSPTVLTISSDSLGLCVWLLPEHDPLMPWGLEDYYKALKKLAVDGGLVSLEVYPAPPDPRGPYHGQGRNCHRRPCGQGSATLTSTGIVEGWREQLTNFSCPGPLPSIEQVVGMMIERWEALHIRWRGVNWRDNWPDRACHVDGRIAELRAWVAEGCPDCPSDCPTPKGTNEALPPTEAPKSSVAPQHDVVLPEEVLHLSHPDLLCKLATQGVPSDGLLNWSLIQLVSQLIRYEQLEDDVVLEVLESWVLSKHNGKSSRVQEGDVVLGKDLISDINRMIKRVRSEKVVEGSHSLKVQYLIMGRGPMNSYLPGFSSSSPSQPAAAAPDVLCVYPFDNTENRSQPEWVQQLMAEKNDWYDIQLQKIKAIDVTVPIPKTIEKVIASKFRNKTTREGVKRLLLFLRQQGTARIHRTILGECFGVSSPNRIVAIKTTLAKARLIEMVSKHHQGHQSTGYTLGSAARSLTLRQ
jgi:hypothetical protein